MARQQRASSCLQAGTRISATGPHRAVLQDWKSITRTVHACADLLHSHARLRDQLISSPVSLDKDLVVDHADARAVTKDNVKELSLMCVSHGLDGLPEHPDDAETTKHQSVEGPAAKRATRDMPPLQCCQSSDRRALLEKLYMSIDVVSSTDFGSYIQLCSERREHWSMYTNRSLDYIRTKVQVLRLGITFRWQREEILSLYFKKRQKIVTTQKRVYDICCQNHLRLMEMHDRMHIGRKLRLFFKFMNVRWPAWQAIAPMSKKCNAGGDKFLRARLHDAERVHLFERAKRKLSQCFYEYTRFIVALDASRETLLDSHERFAGRIKRIRRPACNKRKLENSPTLKPKLKMPTLRYPVFFSMEDVPKYR